MTLIADPQFWMTAAIFTLLAIASGQIGKYITRWRLPLISGYILAGIVMGPYVLKLLDAQAVVDLRIVDEMALAFIAFSAGTHLYLPDIRHHIKSIGWITLSIAVGVPVAGTATRAAETIEGAAEADVEITKCEGFTVDAMAALDLEHTDAVVCLLDDEENLKLCKVIDEYYGTPILVVRLNDRSLFDRFHEYGALIVDPGSAMVSLMDHLVRSPVATSIMLGMERGKDVLDIEVRDPDYHGKAIRDLRLPLDTVILSVRRGDQILVSHGFTRLNVGDKISVVGPRESLKKVELMFDR